MASSSKVDMTLDDIIALNKPKRGRRGTPSRGQGVTSRGWGTSRGQRTPSRGWGTPIRGGRRGLRGRGRVGRNQGSSQSTGTVATVNVRGRTRGLRGRGQRGGRGGRGDRIQVLQQRQRQTIQITRQDARNTSMDSNRNLQSSIPRGQANKRGRGRRSLVRPTATTPRRGGVTARGRGQNINTPTNQRMRRGVVTNQRARGIQRFAAASVARARKRLQNQHASNRQPQIRGGRQRGRGRSRGQGRQQSQATEMMQVISAGPQWSYHPEGIDLAPDFAATHHTMISLDNRFTPTGNKSIQRLVLPNGRAVEYQN